MRNVGVGKTVEKLESAIAYFHKHLLFLFRDIPRIKNVHPHSFISLAVSPNGEEKGVAMFLKTTPKFFNHRIDNEEKEDRQSFKLLLRYGRKYRRHFGQIIVGLLLGSLLQLVLPFLTQSIVDVGIKKHRFCLAHSSRSTDVYSEPNGHRFYPPLAVASRLDAHQHFACERLLHQVAQTVHVFFRCQTDRRFIATNE